MKLEDGWFKFVPESAEVYPCPYEANCRAPETDASGAVGQSLCADGSGGALCSVCDRDYYDNRTHAWFDEQRAIYGPRGPGLDVNRHMHILFLQLAIGAPICARCVHGTLCKASKCRCHQRWQHVISQDQIRGAHREVRYG